MGEVVGADDADRRFPLVSLVAVNPHGLTFRSRCELPIGSRLELGIHVRIRAGVSEIPDASSASRSQDSSRNRYVPLSGYVVVSHLGSHEGRPLYEVTLLFDKIDPEDALLLSQVPEADAARSRPITSLEWGSQGLAGLGGYGATQAGPRSVVELN